MINDNQQDAIGRELAKAFSGPETKPAPPPTTAGTLTSIPTPSVVPTEVVSQGGATALEK
jgi:hypothetical protein